MVLHSKSGLKIQSFVEEAFREQIEDEIDLTSNHERKNEEEIREGRKDLWMTPNNSIKDIQLMPMERSQTEDVVNLISLSMNPSEGRWAQRTMALHFFLQGQNVDDGRKYFVAICKNRVIGITGLHSYEWGPRDITWLGWFALDKEFQGKGFGAFLMQETLEQARVLGYRKIFIETYSSEDFARARTFYNKFGFQLAGQISGYLDTKTDMVVYAMNL